MYFSQNITTRKQKRRIKLKKRAQSKMNTIFTAFYLLIFFGSNFLLADDRSQSKLSIRSIDASLSANSDSKEIKTNSCKYAMRGFSSEVLIFRQATTFWKSSNPKSADVIQNSNNNNVSKTKINTCSCQ